MDLFKRVRAGPAYIRVPMRSAWHLWKRIEEVCASALVVPRTISRLNVERRILGIFHFQEHAAFLGDMMEFLEILNVLRVENELEKVDLCYIDDQSNPNRPVSRERLESSTEFKQMMLDLRHVLPSRGAVFQFDSDVAFEHFFRTHYDRYVCWPQYGRLHSWPGRVNYTRISERGIAFPNTYAPLNRYFDANGTLPKLTCSPEMLAWASDFVRMHISPAIPVAAQIRLNDASALRNSDIEAWKTFFRKMEAHSEIKFILLCRREEIVPDLRSLRNVIYSKDHASGVLEDLALIQVSHMSMFPDAGFCTYPWFSGLPSIYFGKQQHDFTQRRMGDESGSEMKFLSNVQRRRFGAYTADTLGDEFWSLWKDLAIAKWKNPYCIGA